MAGRPPFRPSDADRELVKNLAAFGVTTPDIATLIKDARGKSISDRTVHKYFAAELREGAIRANAEISGALFRKARSGDTACMIFWLKVRARWSEVDKGADDKKIDVVIRGGLPD